MCAQVLTAECGPSVRSAAQELGVAQSTLRYRLKRRAEGAVDGRRHKPEACAAHDGVIQAWMESQQQRQQEGQRPEPVRALYDTLVREHGYEGTYKAVARYVRRRRPPPKVRPLRRVEVRPGSQAQVDWVEPWVQVRELGGRTRLSAFSLSLSFSRMWSVQWRLDQGQLSWQEAHNRALKAVQGVPLERALRQLQDRRGPPRRAVAILLRGQGDDCCTMTVDDFEGDPGRGPSDQEIGPARWRPPPRDRKPNLVTKVRVKPVKADTCPVAVSKFACILSPDQLLHRLTLLLHPQSLIDAKGCKPLDNCLWPITLLHDESPTDSYVVTGLQGQVAGRVA